MSQPIIGITTFRMNPGHLLPRLALNEAYIRAVQRAGGIPVLLPVGITADQFDALGEKLDGFLLTGGVDIDPARYGAPMHPEVTELDPARDEMEIALVHWLLASQKPFLGICRGIEVINVAMGGTLYTHISDQLPNALHHPCYADLPRSLISHHVDVAPGSRLAGLLGDVHVGVNSLHHQGIRDLAPGLQATAHAGDGLVEGIELSDHPFALGVQWHPEELVDHAPMLHLFMGLIGASSRQPAEAR